MDPDNFTLTQEPRRQPLKPWQIIGLSILAILLALVVWGLFEPYMIQRTEYEVLLPNLPVEWEGERIAVIGDFQIGMWMDNEWTIARIVDRLVEEQPAAVLVVGDFVYHTGNRFEEIEKTERFLRPLILAGIPTYAVLGNHDYSLAKKGGQKRDDVATALSDTLEVMGIPVLQNEALPLTSSSGTQTAQPLYIVGIGSRYAQNDLPDIALESVPEDASRIVMMHNPDTFPSIPAHSAPLAVAGHTHGGQIAIPFLPQWSWIALTQEDETHVDGWIEASYGAPGNRLYVNRGIGFSVIPMRISARPEMTVFTLTAAE